MNSGGAVLFVAAWIGCAAPGHAPRSVERPRVDGCAALAAERDALLAQGQIARAARAMTQAGQACPEPPPLLAASQGALLAELGDAAGAEAIAVRLAAAGDDAGPKAAEAVRAAMARFAPRLPADAEARSTTLDEIDRAAEAFHAKDYGRSLAGYERAWDAWHPLAKASVGAGLAALALGRRTEGRRILDRALAEARAPDGEDHIDRRDFLLPPFSASPQAASPDGRLLAVTFNGVGVFDRASGRLVTTLDPLPGGPLSTGISFDAPGTRVAYLEGDMLVVHHALSGRLLSAHPLQPRYDLPPGREATAFSPDGRRVAFVTRGVGVLDLDSGALHYLEHDPRFAQPAALAWSSDGGQLAVGYHGGVSLWDAKTLRRTRSHRAEGQILSLRFGEGDQVLDYATAWGAAFYTRRNAVTGAVTRQLAVPADGSKGSTTATAELSGDGEHVTRVSEEVGLEVWSTASGEHRVISRWPGLDGWQKRGPRHAPRLVFPAPGDAVLGGCANRVCAYDARAGADATASPRVIVGSPDVSRWTVARSSRGNAIVEVDTDDLVRVWDLAAGALRVLPFATGCAERLYRTVIRPDPSQRIVTLDDAIMEPERLVRIIDMSPDGSSFRVVSCRPVQSVHVPELEGAPEVHESGVSTLAGIEGLRAGIVRRDDAFDLVGPDGDADAARAFFHCYAGGVFPLELCEDELRVPGLLRGVERADDRTRAQ